MSAAIGNCLGLPNIGGETVFDPCYQTNPLVNALCVGSMRHEQIHVSSARGAGNLVVLYGALTGGDGIGGVSVLASESFDETGPSKRPAVQVGDPFTEKLLIECTLEVLHAGLVEGIQDLGGAGLSCAASEMASNGDGGMHVWLERVPLRDATLTPEEILMSESQERMCAVVTPANRDAFMAICEKWGVTATVIGEVTDGDRLVIEWHGEVVVDVPPRTVAHDGPVYHRPLAEPVSLKARQDVPTQPEHSDPRETLLALLSAPNHGSKAWVTDQYDRYVRGNTALAQPEDAGVIRIDEQSGRGIALATDCNARFVELDPYSARSSRWRRPTATSRRPGPCRSRSRTASTSARRRTRGHVAVLPVRDRTGRRLPGTGDPGDRRQCQLLQPDRRDRDPPDPRRWECWGCSTTSRAVPRWPGDRTGS